ncbi:MAG: mannose-6-phosphate isomerase, class I [Streptosporangiaceae bacterium]|nr:mannose-6-phosphate isomerase, class I [Streptosporangiaceae bacterium]
MELLQPVIRPYAWGSAHGIAELQGRPVPAAGPEAELWMGAHPSAPSGVARNGHRTTLDAVIAADPQRELGAGCVARFGTRLPFMLKVLSAARALSIQVHPSRAQAQAGFCAENERGLAAGDPARNYTDDWPKPELLCAFTPFEALAGLRPPADAAGILRALGVGQLRPLAAELEAAAGPQVLPSVLAGILDWPLAGRERLVGDVAAACAGLAAGNGPYADACAAAAREAAHHPGDLGVVAMLLMRHAVLRPGQALFMPAGGLHAYLRGTAVEVLANSDNVVRAGLTGKHVDTSELLALLDPAVTVPVLAPRGLAAGVATYDTPAPEFRLHVASLAGETAALPGAGPRILLCTAGVAVLGSESGAAAKVGRGESCFVSAADGTLWCTGPARAFIAGAGSADATAGAGSTAG